MHSIPRTAAFLSCLIFLAVFSASPALSAQESIFFGSYEQDNDLTNGTEPIQWRILDVQDTRVLLLSEKALDCRKYNGKYNNRTFYENADIRAWLNETFYTSAFSAEEQEKILLSTLQNPRKKSYASKGGNDTEDLVFLLSFQEVENYLPEKSDRVCEATPYCLSLGVRTKKTAACPWWLRTPGREQHHAACVTLDGGYYDFFDITCPTNGIRPALWVSPSVLSSHEAD